MILDDFVGRYRLNFVPEDITEAVCPWCEWNYDLAPGQLMADVLRDLERHMVDNHRQAAP